MKKHLLFVSALIATTAVSAQITITDADFPTIGQSYVRASSDSATTTYGTSGANQTWDFSAWGTLTLDWDTTEYHAPAGLLGASNFPSATHASKSPSEQGISYLRLTSTVAEGLGIYDDVVGLGTYSAVTFSPALVSLTLPLTYGDNFGGTSTMDFKMAYSPAPFIDSMRVKNVMDHVDTVDAWGTILTPAITMAEPALRLKQITVMTDTQWVYVNQVLPPNQMFPNGTTLGWNFFDAGMDTTYDYNFWANGYGEQVASISFSEGETLYDVDWLDSTFANLTTSIATATASQTIEVFPNPATDKITIANVATESMLFVFDVNGKMVEKTVLKRNNTALNVTNYNNGVYFYTVAPLNGGVTTTGKFVVSK